MLCVRCFPHPSSRFTHFRCFSSISLWLSLIHISEPTRLPT
ncbi:hypothetical protein ACN6Q1_06970 [Acinetobacter baumannii]